MKMNEITIMQVSSMKRSQSHFNLQPLSALFVCPLWGHVRGGYLSEGVKNVRKKI